MLRRSVVPLSDLACAGLAAILCGGCSSNPPGSGGEQGVVGTLPEAGMVAAGSANVGAATGPGGGSDVGGTSGDGSSSNAAASNWAGWPMPNSAPDVAADAPNAQSYTVNGDETVTDNVTRLMWQREVPSMAYTWSDAVAYCPGLTLGGYSDWRLPTVIELVSILNFGESGYVIDTSAFSVTPESGGGYWWSATPAAGVSGNAFYVVYRGGLGGPGYLSTSSMLNVRCVR